MTASRGAFGFEEADVPRRRRRPLLALIIVIVVLALIAVGLVLADGAVRSYAEDRVATEIRTGLGLPASTPLDVTIGGTSMLAQLATGRLETVEVDADSVTFGDLTGPARLVARGVPIDQSSPAQSVALTFAATAASLTAVSQNLSGVPIDAVSIDGDDIEVTGEFTALFLTVPLAVSLEPRAEAGSIAFTPTAIRVADAEFDAAGLRDRFGSIADTVLATQNLCVAEYVPAALTLDDVSLTPVAMVLRFSGSNVPLTEAGLSQLGTC